MQHQLDRLDMQLQIFLNTRFGVLPGRLHNFKNKIEHKPEDQFSQFRNKLLGF